MFSTLFFLLLTAFYLWYLASPQVKLQPSGIQVYVVENPQPARLVGGGLLLLTAVLFGLKLGWMTGLSTWLVGLMGVGGLVVALAPFRYLNGYVLLGMYVVFLSLELLF